MGAQDVGAGSTEKLFLEGIIYPPASEDTNGRSIGHLCEEFTVKELKSELSNFCGIPIAIEHDCTEVPPVGS